MSVKEGSLEMLSRIQLEKAGFSDIGAPLNSGQSVVYRAYHNATAQYVALKIFPPSESNRETLREATAIASINHPNIAHFVSAGYLEDLAYITTQWIDGVRLSDHLALHGPLPVKDAIRLTSDIADGLSATHTKNWVHGDLSPSNILRDCDGQGVLIDFGLGDQASDETIIGVDSIAGTPRYLAPEIIAGEKPSPQSDQYALALICYEMLTAVWPFCEDNKPDSVNLATALHHQLYSPPVPLSEHDPSFSADADQVFMRALSKDPNQRFPDVKTFCEQLTLATSDSERTITPNDLHTHWLKSSVLGRISLVATGLFILAGMLSYVGFFPMTFKSSVAVAGTEMTESTQSDGDPASLTCNLMPNPGFNSVLSDNFYKDDKNPHAVKILTNPSITSSPLLHVGGAHEYGMYGQIIKIKPNELYNFSAQVFISGEVEHAELYVSWLDEDWQLIEGTETDGRSTVSLRIETHSGRQVLSDIKPPAHAWFAVPSVFKNASGGKLEIDNISFSAVGSLAEDC